MEYKKDYDKWSSLKESLNNLERGPFVRPREIWWCSIGVNIGEEIDGKNVSFERPVLILKVYNMKTVLVLPITTKPKNDRFHYKVTTAVTIAWIKLSQPRTISTKRFIRRVGALSREEFLTARQIFKDSI